MPEAARDVRENSLRLAARADREAAERMVDATGRRIQKPIAPVHVNMNRTTALAAAHRVNDIRRMRRCLS